MLGNKKGKMICGYVPDYVLFDLETTGTSCIYDEVIEISAVKVRSGKVVEEFSQLVNPKRPIPYAASMVNHISDEMVANEPDFGQVLPEFLTFAGDDILVGHNIQTFDMKFLYRDCERLFQQKLTNDYVDTLRVAKLCFPEWRHRRLSDLAEHYGISLMHHSPRYALLFPEDAVRTTGSGWNIWQKNWRKCRQQKSSRKKKSARNVGFR